MRFIEIESENPDYTIYEAYQGERKAARFMWEIREDKTALIREIRMEPEFGSYEDISGILEFIQYKALSQKADNMQMEFLVKNRMLADILLRFGFYVIDRHISKGAHGQEEMTCVMKCPIR